MFKNFVNKGDKFGRLTVLYEEEPTKKKDGRSKRTVFCRCSCGNELSVPFNNLWEGKTKSCGCLSRDACTKRLRKFNTYEVCGDYTKVFDSKGNSFIIDTEDLEKIKPYYFQKTFKGYVSTSYLTCGAILLHRLIMDAPKDLQVDHINHDKLDNRKSNLRLCTRCENQRNRKCLGVWFRKDTKKWIAEIQNKKLGHFETKEEAIACRKKAEIELYGEFRYKGSYDE